MDLLETGKFSLIVFLVLLTIDVLVWLLWANKVILEQQSHTLLRWNVGLIMIIWLIAAVVGAIGSVLMMLYAWLA